MKLSTAEFRQVANIATRSKPSGSLLKPLHLPGKVNALHSLTPNVAKMSVSQR